MTTEEAKVRIKEEFMSRYEEWFSDLHTLNDHDFGWKYGLIPKDRASWKDNLKAVTSFQRNFFDAGRTLEEWKKKGFDRDLIMQLCREGFLGQRTLQKWVLCFMITQKTAKEIYKEYRKAA